MGEYGMTYESARRVPPAELFALWRASERRMARKELRLLDDLFAVAGLQSEVRIEGEKPKKGKRATPVALNERRAALNREGYPMKRKPYDPERDQKKLQAFWQQGAAEQPVIVPEGEGDADQP